MSRPHDPDHGELRRLADGLSAPQAEMLAEDLRDLQIPVQVELDEATATFAVHVPEVFEAMARRVLAAFQL